MDLNQITLPAQDIAASLAFYKQLGLVPLVESPHYARLKSPTGNTTLSIDAAKGDVAAPAAVVYFECGALDMRVAELKAQGLQFTQDPKDEPWQWREARLSDPSGNTVCLYSAGGNRLNPPWRVGGQLTNGLVVPVLQTARLLLRPVQVEDLPDFFQINRDPEVTRYLPYGTWMSMADATAWYHRMLGLMLSGGMAYNAVVEQASGKVIGGALLRYLDADAGKLEVGYVLGRSHWGKGLMREAVQALVAHAFDHQPALRRIEAHIDGRNLGSQSLVEGLGFRREAVLRDHWKDTKGAVSDSLIYGVLRKEWFSNFPPGRPKEN